mmetsp:Transcript_56343/g.182983  ORF Transcript_56343/g.182983 Transcript_56343/m.182983 type:complete len:248 (-) Transcript_56343:6064-6807(-)
MVFTSSSTSRSLQKSPAVSLKQKSQPQRSTSALGGGASGCAPRHEEHQLSNPKPSTSCRNHVNTYNSPKAPTRFADALSGKAAALAPAPLPKEGQPPEARPSPGGAGPRPTSAGAPSRRCRSKGSVPERSLTMQYASQTSDKFTTCPLAANFACNVLCSCKYMVLCATLCHSSCDSFSSFFNILSSIRLTSFNFRSTRFNSFPMTSPSTVLHAPCGLITALKGNSEPPHRTFTSPSSKPSSARASAP